ncbi:MAG: InlB B-repeat-containing protein [Oscillospiraceae bacterium]|nr:MAG: InlB B-repeat-containing protein [Oscillospiraceae bacterium]
MRKSVKKVLSGIMAGMMILTAAPVSALAANYTPGQVIEKADLPAAKSLSPKLDVVWTAYTGKDQAFYKNGDENWITDGATVTDLSKVSVEGQTVGSDGCTLKANSKGEYFVAASFILHDTAGQFGNVQFKYEVNSALTPGVRSNPTTGWSKTAKLLAMADEAMVDANGEAYMTDNASDVNGTEQYICYGTRLVNDEVPDATWQGDTSTLYNSDEDTNVVIDGIYIATVGFKVAAGTKIEDSLLTFNTDPLMTKYSSIAFGNENEIACSYTMTGISEEGDAEVGLFEVPMKASAPETKSYTVNYVTEDGASLGTEKVEEGKSPASVPALPTKAPDAAGHYSYAWDTDPTTATISADTTFTAKLTTTPHNPQTMDSNIVDATCGKDGSKTVTTSCSDCGYVISVENNVVIPATKNHTPAAAVKENVKPATCETAETYDSVVYCSVCGQEISRTQMTGEAALGHKWGEWKHDDSTAKAESKHTRTCENDATHTDSAACNFTSQVTQNQTADQPEITTYTCKDCGYSYTEETKPALGHTHNYGAPVADYTSGEAFVEGKNYTHTATCTGEGTCSQPTKTDKCTFNNGVETKAATCTEPGVKTFTCTECGGTYTVAIPATDHNWGDWKHVEGTEGADAKHSRVCANDASHTETKACDFTAKVTQEATLDQPEITTYTCKDCGYFYTKETAPALAGVTVTVNAVENGSVTLAGQDVTAGGSKKFAENGTYTLVATPNADCTFVGWQTGNKIVSTDATYTTVAIADITYTPVFAESAKPVQFTFVDMFNNVISSQPVASGADVKIPQAPTYTGYTFTGWSVDEAAIKAATSSMTVYAQYEKDAAATYTVTTDADATVAYGSNSAQGTLADIPYGTQVTVSKADATAWAIDGKIVAYGDSYTFYVASDVTVKAASATTQAPVVAAVSANQVAGSYKVEFVATRAMVDGCTYLKSGFVYGKNLTDADLTLANVGKKGSADNSGVVKAAYANSTEGSTQFILSYGISAQTGTASAKAFLTYKDQNGKVQTVYSDVMSHTYA